MSDRLDELRVKGTYVRADEISDKEHRVTWAVCGRVFVAHGKDQDAAIDDVIEQARKAGKTDDELGLGVKPATEAPSAEDVADATG